MIDPHVNHGLLALDMAQRNREELDMLWDSLTKTLDLLARQGTVLVAGGPAISQVQTGAVELLAQVQAYRLKVSELREKR